MWNHNYYFSSTSPHIYEARDCRWSAQKPHWNGWAGLAAGLLRKNVSLGAWGRANPVPLQTPSTQGGTEMSITRLSDKLHTYRFNTGMVTRYPSHKVSIFKYVCVHR